MMQRLPTRRLPQGFLDRPFAHRGLHGPGRPENSSQAVEAALNQGYAIEIDVRLSRDGKAVVFHDATLDRVTGVRGNLSDLTASEINAAGLLGGPTGAPLLSQVLKLIDGRAPLLIEIKDRDGALGPTDGALELAVARDLSDYIGPVAVMSFSAFCVGEMARIAPSTPRGLVTCEFGPDWRDVPEKRREELRRIASYGHGACAFISHDVEDLESPHVAKIKDTGAPVVCWCVVSPEQEKLARKTADQITFEDYLA